MDYLGSAWSSGCESGWTGYFDDSSLSSNQWRRGRSDEINGNKSYKVAGLNSIRDKKRDDGDDEEDDLSMVSDASSGPPPPGHHFSTSDKKKNKKKKTASDHQIKGKQHQHQKHSYLDVDDTTATSPALNLSKGNSAYSDHFGSWKSSHSKRSDSSAEPSHTRGKSTTWK